MELTYSCWVIDICRGLQVRVQFVILVANVHPLVSHNTLEERGIVKEREADGDRIKRGTEEGREE